VGPTGLDCILGLLCIDWGDGVNGILIVPFPPTLELRVASVQSLNAAQKRCAALNRDERGGLIIFIPGSASLGRTASISDGSAKNEHSVLAVLCRYSRAPRAHAGAPSASEIMRPPLLEGGGTFKCRGGPPAPLQTA
jgi:hypothetical protein